MSVSPLEILKEAGIRVSSSDFEQICNEVASKLKRNREKSVDDPFQQATSKELENRGIDENWGLWFKAIGAELGQRQSNKDSNLTEEIQGEQQNIFD